MAGDAGAEVLGRWRSALTPVLMLGFALLSAGALAYGTRAGLARYDWGLEAIIFVRRVQWLLVGMSLLSCMGLLILVIANKLDVWWLIGLVLVLALFAVRFSPTHARPTYVLDFPRFVLADHAAAPGADEYVVGLIFEGESYAFPYRALHGTPIVAVTDYSKRMLLVWSAQANRALAVQITRDLRPRALEVVSTPAGGMLILDRRYGQFISSITGRTVHGDEPIGFSTPIPVTKTTWGAWRELHPQTRVMLPAVKSGQDPTHPARLLATLPPRASRDAPANSIVAVLETDPPIAVSSDDVADHPLNVVGHGDLRILLFRDPRTGSIRAFERRVSGDLFPIFSIRHGPGTRPDAPLLDSDTQSLWTLDGRAVDGPARGEQLREINVEDHLYWGVMKYWYPALRRV